MENSPLPTSPIVPTSPSVPPPTPTSLPPQVQNSNPKSKLPFILLSLLGAITTGVLGYYLGKYDPLNISSDTTPPSLTACTLEAKICPDGSSVGRSGPNCEFDACPVAADTNISTWVRKQYISNEQVVWDVLQPTQTIANEGGLHEGYLGLTSTLDGRNTIMAEFSFPIFESQVPTTLEEWLNIYQTKDLGDTYTNRTVTDISHLQNIPIKMIKTTSISPGGNKNISTATFFILIWKHQDQAGTPVNPSLITVKPVSNPELDSKIVENFATNLVQGLRF